MKIMKSWYLILLGLSVLFYGHCTPVATCKDGWTMYQGSCYLFTEVHATWIEAENYCGFFGAALAEIETQNESNFIETTLKSKHSQDPHVDIYSYWIEANDIQVEGEFVWAKSGSRLTYTDWSPSQPDNTLDKSYVPEEEDCIEIFASNGKWNDRPCSYKNFFVCKMPEIINSENVIGKKK